MTIVLSAIAFTVLIAVLIFPHVRRYQLRRFPAALDVDTSSINTPIWRMPAIHPFVSSIQGVAEKLRTGKFRRPAGAFELTNLRAVLPMRPTDRTFVPIFSFHLGRADVRTQPHPEGERKGTSAPTDASAGREEGTHGAPSLGTLDLLPVAALMIDKYARIVAANGVAETLFGYRKGELSGIPWDALVPSLRTDSSPVSSALGRPVPAVMTVSGGLDVAARHKDGTEFPVEVTANPVWWDDKPHSLTVIMDRTERYELQRNRQQLAHLTRVSTLGELAGSLAHELNQPLTAILSNVQAAQRFMATQPINLDEVREILHDLVEDNHRASEVIRKIRVLAKKGEFEAAPLSVASVIEDVAVLVHSDAIVRGIRVFLSVAPNLPTAHGDRVQLQQVVLNLMLNAFDALEFRSAPSPEVTVEARLENNNTIRVAVRDNGSGIADDRLDKLFVPFYTSKREGLGLGLSISRSIVNMHGGAIWVENNSDLGATFCFTLPVAATPERECSHRQP
jgi:two-component system sensor kinase FixL